MSSRRMLCSIITAAVASVALVGCGSTATDDTQQAPSSAASAKPSASALGFPTSSPISGPEPGEIKRINLPSGRYFLLRLPQNYSAQRQWPVLLSFHGWSETAETMSAYTDFDAAQAIVAFPQGQDKAWAPAPYATATGEQDVAFVRAVVDALRATYVVDDQRIYAAGMSNGGGFAAYLGCQMPEVFAAVASVSAAYYDKIHDGCRKYHATPVGRLDIHGTDDPVVSYFGGRRHGEAYSSVMDVLSNDEQRNECSEQIVTTRLSNNSVRMSWTGCSAPLEHIRIGGGSHVWPGGKYDKSNGLPEGFASDAVLDFFAIPGRVAGTENSANEV
ncbi:alpha/beta hydrolase family esterase [Corynebacterium lizhenjunii]|uniref:alpha/beta hydrolase family esterase n=1 Tax=Corynebacterium lizhenjunii TaxID=2709394 RepID=UPI001EE9B505|nr:PHB depolymerase family esterase [Corynebacterium lizhenjunii]